MSRPRVFHIRDKDIGDIIGAVTLAIRKNEDGTFAFGMGLCSPADQFCKRVGRLIATGRLDKKPLYATDFVHLGRAIKHAIRSAWVPRGFLLDADMLCKLIDERLDGTRAFIDDNVKG